MSKQPNPDCGICGGSGIIRLPVRHRSRIGSYDYKTPEILPIRQYSCPECGDYIPNEKVLIVQAEDIANGAYVTDIEYIRSIRNSIALKIGDFLFRENQIGFTETKLDEKEEFNWGRGSYSIKGELGVISPRTVATFQQRVNQRQAYVARIVADEVVKQIRNWNSYYDKGNGPIQKDMAINFIFEVLEKTLKQLEATKS